MPHDPARVADTKAWLGRAATDLRAAAVDLAAVPLTEYAWKFRYPGEHEGPTRDEAEGALVIAREAFEAILVRLPEDVRP